MSQGALTRENLQRALVEQQRTAGRLGEILVARGYVHRLDVYRALSDAWGMPHVDLSRHLLDGALIDDLGIDVADLAGAPWVPLVREHGTLVVATTERPSPELEADVRVFAGPVGIAWMVTTEWDIRNAVLRSFGAELTRRASSDLAARAPDDSASRVVTRPQVAVLLACLAALVAVAFIAPLSTANGIFLALNIAVVANVAFKALAIVAGFGRRARRVVAEVPDVPDSELPRYTVLVPAFGEANVIADLVEHLGHLDYPRDRLEVLLLLEEVDRPTIEAAMGSGLPAFVRIVVVPDGQPRTKPKACNVGLNFAHGEFLVIYDAEDRPAPDQLRKAVAAFRAAPPEMICLQARLSYWNVDENALTRFFTLEYAHWFDLMLDGLAALRLPIPLGGTSNHFRVAAAPCRRRLGPAQRDRGRRPRPARRGPGHDRLDARLDDPRGGVLPAVAVDQAAHAVDQGLHADGARPHAAPDPVRAHGRAARHADARVPGGRDAARVPRRAGAVDRLPAAARPRAQPAARRSPASTPRRWPRAAS